MHLPRSDTAMKTWTVSPGIRGAPPGLVVAPTLRRRLGLALRVLSTGEAPVIARHPDRELLPAARIPEPVQRAQLRARGRAASRLVRHQ